MNKIAVIGGSHFASLKNLVITHSTSVKTPYGEPSAPLSYGILGNQEVIYLPRRGSQQPMPPHQINYRANIWALRDAGVQTVIATAAVAGIKAFAPGDVVLPNQLIDYTYGRENTFLGDSHETDVIHINFTEPYSEKVRQQIFAQGEKIGVKVATSATYAITQGPRLETAAEIERIARDGCHLVGMTGMPEAALARELGLDYACIALVVRQASSSAPFDASILSAGEKCVEDLVEAFILDDALATS